MTDLLGDVRTGVNRGATYGLFGAPEPFMHHVRALGGRFARVNLFWSQIEPEPDRFDWTVVDTLLGQLQNDDELWITVCAASPWATRQATRFLPASPAKDPSTYESFVGALVRRARGLVRFWQCEIEPNIPLLWSGGPDDYLAHLRAFHRAVKQADPNALVVLGAAVPGAMTADDISGNSHWIAYFDRVLAGAGDWFDVFDIHPYGDSYQIPALIEACRRQMGAHGYAKPIAASEFNGPMPTSFPRNLPYLGEVLAAHRRQFLGQTPIPQDGVAASRTEPAVTALYERSRELPESLRMFLDDCPADLESRRFRMTGRDIVTRTLLLLAAGVRRTAVFQLAPEASHEGSTHTVRALMFGTFALMGYEGAAIGPRYPTADTVELLSRHLGNLTDVHRIHLAGRPDLYLFDLRTDSSDPLLVAWSRRDGFGGEEEPPVPFDWPWPLPAAHAVDALGTVVPVKVAGGYVHLSLSLTPTFITSGSHR
ncbi:hypothetical protein [Nonomuraea sp. NPDC003709]|uniref:hypothetical protein n=1 Tax=Nonomuraea sp. NPDC003709 TaxID=3154450 RepID=UPI0033A3051E